MRRALPLLLLAACSKPAEEKAAAPTVAPATVAAEAAKLRLQPGTWETTTLITALDVPGVLPEGLKAATGTRTTTRNCVSAADAEARSADLLSGSASANCSYRRFSVAGARIDAALTCAPAAAAVAGVGNVAMTLNGDHSPTAFDVALAMKTDLPGGQAMTMTARVDGRRTGDCSNTAGETSI